MTSSPFENHLVQALQQAIISDDKAHAQNALESLRESARSEAVFRSMLTDLLHLCIEWDRVELAQLLIQSGAPLEGRDEEGSTPLMHAVDSCSVHPPMVRALIQAGADADAESRGCRIIEMAEAAPVPEQVKSEVLEILWKAPRSNRTVPPEKPRKPKGTPARQ